jgi:hypothetical protein
MNRDALHCWISSLEEALPTQKNRDALEQSHLHKTIQQFLVPRPPPRKRWEKPSPTQNISQLVFSVTDNRTAPCVVPQSKLSPAHRKSALTPIQRQRQANADAKKIEFSGTFSPDTP